MESFLPLLVLLAISWFISSLGKKTSRQAKTTRAGVNRPASVQTPKPVDPAAGTKPQPKPAPAAPKQAVPSPAPSFSEQAQQHVHRGKDGTLHPTERRSASSTASAFMSDPTEGDDPCHAYMLDDPNLPDCDDDETPPAVSSGFSLRFTRDEVVNAVVMSEVLNRRNAKKRAG